MQLKRRELNLFRAINNGILLPIFLGPIDPLIKLMYYYIYMYLCTEPNSTTLKPYPVKALGDLNIFQRMFNSDKFKSHCGHIR